MRSFPLLYIIVFFILFGLLAGASVKMLSKITPTKRKRKVRWILLSIHGLILGGFFLLYIYPFHPLRATNYPLYFYFNGILFLLLIFDIPLALALLVDAFFRKRSRIIAYAGFIFSVALSLTIIYGIIIGSGLVKVKQITIHFSDLPAGFDGYRIVQIADLHAGSMLSSSDIPRKTKILVRQSAPDLLVFTGDLVNNFASEIKDFTPEFREMTAHTPSWAVLGNHDYGDYTFWESKQDKKENFESIVSLYSDLRFSLLNNENTVIYRNKDSLFLAGVENWGHADFPKYSDIEQALEGIPPDAFTILLTHNPAHWAQKVKGKKPVDLTLSGHTHGLQWGLKPAGIPFSLSFLTGKYWGGLYREDSAALYVNTGLGVVGTPWRIDMPAEITVITLKRGEVD